MTDSTSKWSLTEPIEQRATTKQAYAEYLGFSWESHEWRSVIPDVASILTYTRTVRRDHPEIILEWLRERRAAVNKAMRHSKQFQMKAV